MSTIKTFNPSYYASKAWQEFVTAQLLPFSVPSNQYGVIGRPFSLPDYIRNVVIPSTYNHVIFPKRAKIGRIKIRLEPVYKRIKRGKISRIAINRPLAEVIKKSRNSDTVMKQQLEGEGSVKPLTVIKPPIMEGDAEAKNSNLPAYKAGMYVSRRFGLI